MDNVGGASQPEIFRIDAEHRDRGLGRYPVDASPDKTIQNQISDDKKMLALKSVLES
jgi:hypothetical protein